MDALRFVVGQWLLAEARRAELKGKRARGARLKALAEKFFSRIGGGERPK